MADKNMEAQISVEFEEATSRQSLNSGETINTLWSKVKRWLSDLKTVCFSGSYNDLSDKPTSLPANGGNADTVDGFGVSEYVTTLPEGEYYTEVARINTRGKKIESCDTSNLKVGLADYATNADYAINSNTVNNHTVDSDVPANAVFTDTTNSDVQTSGNPVVMDNLQGGVPFAEIVVSGKNLLQKMPDSVTRNGITYTVNADGTITLSGTAEKADGVDVVTKIPIKAGVYTLSGCPEGGSDTSYALRAGLGTANTLYGRDYGNGLKITVETDTVLTITIQNAEIGRVFDNVIFRPQLELGDTPSKYEPPIIGRDLTVGVCGKNIIAQPTWIEQHGGTISNNGITYTLNDDKSITANGTATADSYCVLHHLTMSENVNRLTKNTDYFLSGSPVGSGANTYLIYAGIYDNDGNRVGIYHDYGSGIIIKPSNDYRCTVSIMIAQGQTVDNLVFRPQLEIGSTATSYEPYSGSVTTITPDSNPYTIPNDIRQQEGLNNISVSAGELSVVGVRKNAAIKRIWDKLDELTTAIIVSNGESE